MTRTVNIVILCEDAQQDAFIRRFLGKTGVQMRSLRSVISPSGRGAGEQFVRQQFIKEFDDYQQRRSRISGQTLIAMIDADGRSRAERVRQLEGVVGGDGKRTREEADRVAIFVPARNIETWFAFLDGSNVDENTSYPRLARERDCQRHVDQLYAMCQRSGANDNESLPPSLRAACEEYQKRVR